MKSQHNTNYPCYLHHIIVLNKWKCAARCIEYNTVHALKWSLYQVLCSTSAVYSQPALDFYLCPHSDKNICVCVWHLEKRLKDKTVCLINDTIKTETFSSPVCTVVYISSSALWDHRDGSKTRNCDTVNPLAHTSAHTGPITARGVWRLYSR